jgi:spore coat polysaccharide biosynthesis protein SpsF
MIPHVGIIVCCAVRLNSSRLPRKALADLAGEPLILRLTERVRQAVRAEDIVWCTSSNPDDDPLEELATRAGITVYRGDELDVLSRFLEVAWSRNAHTVVRVTGDNPLTDPAMMDVMIEAHRAADAEYTYTEDLPRGTRAEILSVAALEKCHDLAEDPSASEYMTLMLRRRDHFRMLKVDSPDPRVTRPELRLTVDAEEDLKLMQALYGAFAGNPPPLAEVIAWLDGHPEVATLNRDVPFTAIDDTINVRLRGDHRPIP